MNKYPFNCVLSCFQRLPAGDLNVHRRSYPPALFLKISDWTLSTWKHVLCSGVNAELYCVVCMWAMSTFAVAYLPLLLIGFLLAPLSYACLYSTHSLSPTWIRMGAGFTVFVIWNDILQFCPRRFHCRWKELRGEEMWFYPHAVWARCLWWFVWMPHCRIFAFSNAWFYSHIYSKCHGIVVISPLLIACLFLNVPSLFIRFSIHMDSMMSCLPITHHSTFLCHGLGKVILVLQCEKLGIWAHLPHPSKGNGFCKFSYVDLR